MSVVELHTISVISDLLNGYDPCPDLIRYLVSSLDQLLHHLVIILVSLGSFWGRGGRSFCEVIRGRVGGRVVISKPTE